MDGVLNSHQSMLYFWRTKHDCKSFMQSWEELCPIACNNLNYLLERNADMKVVISSSWRLHHDIKEWDEKMLNLCPALIGRIIDKTPKLPQLKLSQPRARGDEIKQWLNDNGHIDTPFIIFDDNDDMAEVYENLIQTDEMVGLTYHNILEAFVRLGVSPS